MKSIVNEVINCLQKEGLWIISKDPSGSFQFKKKNINEKN